MARFSKYAPGTFSWVDLMARDAATARGFYTELFGWDVVEKADAQGGIYTEFHLRGVPVAGMGEMNAEMQASGMPPVWNSYVAVDDCDASLQRATELGGQIIVPGTDIEPGRFGIVADSQGAVLTLMKVDAPD